MTDGAVCAYLSYVKGSTDLRERFCGKSVKPFPSDKIFSP